MNIQNIIGNNLLLFAVNIWIKKPQVVNIQNTFLGIISHDYLFNHTSLKKAFIIIGDISNFASTVYESWKYEILKKK